MTENSLFEFRQNFVFFKLFLNSIITFEIK